MNRMSYGIWKRKNRYISIKHLSRGDHGGLVLEQTLHAGPESRVCAKPPWSFCISDTI